MIAVTVYRGPPDFSKGENHLHLWVECKLQHIISAKAEHRCMVNLVKWTQTTSSDNASSGHGEESVGPGGSVAKNEGGKGPGESGGKETKYNSIFFPFPFFY